jgi:hypothetical protein
VHRDPVGITEVEETFQGFRGRKAQEGRALEHRTVAEKSQRPKKPFGGFKFEKLRRVSVFKNADRSRSHRLRSRKQRSGPLKLGKSSKVGRRAHKGEATATVRSRADRRQSSYLGEGAHELISHMS